MALSTQRGPLDAAGLAPLGAPRRRSYASRRQKVLALAVIAGALGFLLARGLSNAMDYYLTAKQAVAQRTELGGKDFRVQGTVTPGLARAGAALRFSITSGGTDVRVVSTGSPPQLFKVGMPVVLEGHWQGDFFSSSQIMVQHSSTYVEAHSPKPKQAVTGQATAPARGARS